MRGFIPKRISEVSFLITSQDPHAASGLSFFPRAVITGWNHPPFQLPSKVQAAVLTVQSRSYPLHSSLCCGDPQSQSSFRYFTAAVLLLL